MDQPQQFCPYFERPPVIETRIGVQFAPLIDFRSGHFGMFWEECLGSSEWQILPDKAFMPKETERFGSKLLRPPVEKETTAIPQVCMELLRKDKTRKIQFQANRLIYGWFKEMNVRPRYTEVRTEFDAIFAKLEAFAKKWELGTPTVNFWDVAYVNNILPGSLWQVPQDWHKVLPGLFPAQGPKVSEHVWSTFTGTWYFEIPKQMGRVKAQAQKVVANQSEQISLLLVVTARGETEREGAPGAKDWKAGLDIGHDSAVRTFVDISSEEALKEWGMKS